MSTAESKPGEGEQLSAHLHITRPARRGRKREGAQKIWRRRRAEEKESRREMEEE